MAKRGRKSGAESSVVTLAGSEECRPDAPEYLTKPEAAIWSAVVDGEPPGWFNTGALQGMLADYCRHRAMADQLSRLVDSYNVMHLKFDEDAADQFKQFVKLRESEIRAAAGLATKLRLTNQSRYTPQSAGTATRNNKPGKKPWEQ